MLYKRDFYTLILEKVHTMGGGIPPSHTFPPLGRFAPSPRTSDKCAPFEVLPLQNSKCSGAPGIGAGGGGAGPPPPSKKWGGGGNAFLPPPPQKKKKKEEEEWERKNKMYELRLVNSNGQKLIYTSILSFR